jgi:small subunit ribosomal protein S7
VLKNFFSGHSYFLRKRNHKQHVLSLTSLKKRKKKVKKLVSLGKSKTEQLFKINVFKTLSLKLLKKGKGRLAENLVNRMFFILRAKGIKSPHKLISEIFTNLKNPLGIRLYKRGRKVFRVPYIVPLKRQYSTAARYLVYSARVRTEKSIVVRLANSILEASKKKGLAFKRRKQIRLIADQNAHLVRKIHKKFKKYRRYLHR